MADFVVGVDLGTTFSAAAVYRDGVARVVPLGRHASAVPSVVFLREDGDLLTGDAAERRGITEPDRLARQFKRRLGDSTPIIIGGAPYSAEALMGVLLKAVVAKVSEHEGGPPRHVT